MGSRGPIGNPEAREMKGTARKPKKRIPITVPDTGMPECPDWLSVKAKVEWQRLAPMLYAAGRLTTLDVDCMANYCMAWAHFKQAQAILDQDGLTVPGPRGSIRPHPAMRIVNNYSVLLHRLSGQLGLSPVARVRLGDTPTTKETEEEASARKFLGF